MNLARMEPLIGQDGIDRLKRARVMVVGLGGVGGYCVEALARAGVGTLDLVDGDVVDETNVNRQLYALACTVGRSKAELAAERVRQINPEARATAYRIFADRETISALPVGLCDAVADCVDTVDSKIALAAAAQEAADSVEFVSCMGSGNKLHADFRAANLFSTKECPLARAMRSAARKAGLNDFTVIYSETPPAAAGQRTPASISYVPAQAGLACAEYVIGKLIG